MKELVFPSTVKFVKQDVAIFKQLADDVTTEIDFRVLIATIQLAASTLY